MAQQQQPAQLNGLHLHLDAQHLSLVLVTGEHCAPFYSLSVDNFPRRDGITLASFDALQLLEVANITERDLNACAADLDKRTLLDERADLIARVQTLDIKLGLIDERADEEAEQ